VAVETDAVGRDTKRRRLADIMQQRAQRERWRNSGGELLEQHERVDPNVALGMELGRLLHALHPWDLGQDLRQQARLIKQLEGAAGAAFRQHLEQLLSNALTAYFADVRRKLADGAQGLRRDGVAEAGSEAHGAQHAKLIFVEATMRLADSTDDFALQVFTSAHEVENFVVVQRIEQQAIDGEVAALHIFFGVTSEAHLIGMTAIGVQAIGAEGGDFNAGPLG
jgi:hypothetical protein